MPRQREQGRAFRTCNPARPSQTVGEYVADTDASIAEIVADASRAFRIWRAFPETRRAEAVLGWIDGIASQAEEIARCIVLEQGKPLAEARGETAKALAEARTMAAFASSSGARMVASSRPGVRNLVVRRPRGVVAALTPWNFPILTPLRKIVPALLAGNAVVIKPSELAPGACLLAVEAARQVLPENVLQYVLGARGAGEALVGAPNITAVSFTGSVAAGRAIGATAGGRLLEQNLELGGKNAAVIAASADVPQAAAQSALAAFACAGQRCTAVSRAIVHESVREEFVDALRASMAGVRMGDGMDADTTMGPLVCAAHRDRVEHAVAQALSEGSRALAGATRVRPEGCEEGFFYAPTLLEAAPDMACAREEIFGPVVTLLSYRSFDEAIEFLNATEYGLAASLFSNDVREIDRFVAEAEAGMLFVNQGTTPDNHMPFVGAKASGVGPGSVGPAALEFATVEHSVYITVGKQA